MFYCTWRTRMDLIHKPHLGEKLLRKSKKKRPGLGFSMKKVCLGRAWQLEDDDNTWQPSNASLYTHRFLRKMHCLRQIARANFLWLPRSHSWNWAYTEPKVWRAIDGLRQWPEALCIVAEELGIVKRDWVCECGIKSDSLEMLDIRVKGSTCLYMRNVMYK